MRTEYIYGGHMRYGRRYVTTWRQVVHCYACGKEHLLIPPNSTTRLKCFACVIPW